MYIAASKGHVGIVKELLQGKAMPDMRGPNQQTPLFIAAQEGHLEVVRVFTELATPPFRVDVNARDHMGWTPLLSAVNEGRASVVRHLTGLPAVDRDVEADDGSNCLDLAEEHGDRDIVFYLLHEGTLAPEPELLPPAPQSTKQGPQYDWEADLRWQEEERAKLKREEEGRVPKLKEKPKTEPAEGQQEEKSETGEERRLRLLWEKVRDTLHEAMSKGRTLYGKKIRTLAQFFSAIDLDDDPVSCRDPPKPPGTVDMEELKKAFHRLGCGLNQAQLEEIFHTLDHDGSGCIIYSELHEAFGEDPGEAMGAEAVLRRRVEQLEAALSNSESRVHELEGTLATPGA